MITYDTTATQRLEALLEALHRKTTSNHQYDRPAIKAAIDVHEQSQLAYVTRRNMQKNSQHRSNGRMMVRTFGKTYDLEFRHMLDAYYLVSAYAVIPNRDTMELEPAPEPLAKFVVKDEHHTGGHPPNRKLEAPEELEQLTGQALMSDAGYREGGYTAWIWTQPKSQQEFTDWKKVIGKAVTSDHSAATDGKALQGETGYAFTTESIHLMDNVYLITLRRLEMDIVNRRLRPAENPAAQLLVANVAG